MLLAVQMALVGRHYERIADHAVTIAERVRLHGDRRAPRSTPRSTSTLEPTSLAWLSCLVVAEVPLEDEVLALGVAGDPLPVAAELRVVRREQLQPGDRALAELVDHAPVAEDAVDLPVGRDRAEVDDLDVTLRRYLLELFGLHRHAGQRSGLPRSSVQQAGQEVGASPSVAVTVTVVAVAVDLDRDLVAGLVLADHAAERRPRWSTGLAVDGHHDVTRP